MSLLKRVNEQMETIWEPVPVGLWRWRLDKPEIINDPRFGYRARFRMQLTEPERDRLRKEYPTTDPNVQQSYRSDYRTGLSLGYPKNGQYVSTKLVDFLSAALGSQQEKAFRDWIAKGGGAPRPADPDNTDEDIACISQWLGWWEGLEVYGSIRHETDSTDPSKTWARWGGPMAIGSLPGIKDDAYQAHGRGKLRAIVLESKDTPTSPAVASADAPPVVQYTAHGREVPVRAAPRPALPEEDDVPF